jgi:hypothetical protein
VPSVDVFLPPLLGGFVFVLLWYPTRFWMRREEGYKFVFLAATAAMVFFGIATLILMLARQTIWGSEVAASWAVHVDVPQLGASLLAFFLLIAVPVVLNFLGKWIPPLSKPWLVDWHIRRRNDAFETLLRESIGSQKQVIVTLKNEKFYVGRVVVNINPAERLESLRLILSKSGYRDAERKLVFTTDYQPAIEELRVRQVDRSIRQVESRIDLAGLSERDFLEAVKKEMDDLLVEPEPFDVVILVNEVRTVGFFDSDVFDEVFAVGQVRPGAPAAAGGPAHEV